MDTYNCGELLQAVITWLWEKMPLSWQHNAVQWIGKETRSYSHPCQWHCMFISSWQKPRAAATAECSAQLSTRSAAAGGVPSHLSAQPPLSHLQSKKRKHCMSVVLEPARHLLPRLGSWEGAAIHCIAIPAALELVWEGFHCVLQRYISSEQQLL